MSVDAVPWCEECSRFLTPTSMGEGGECPRCGSVLAAGESPDDAEIRVPWHFKLLLVATVVYLGWRAVQGIAWVVDRL